MRVALVTQEFGAGGGVSTAAHWLRDGLLSTGDYDVDVHDLATSRRDSSSRRIVSPRSWLRSSLCTIPRGEHGYIHWGANAVEIETMRYRPRAELARALRGYDIAQVVSGSPALASAVLRLGIPVMVQCASTVAWERPWRLAAQARPSRVWRLTMTKLVSRIERNVLLKADAVLVMNATMLDYALVCGSRRVINAPPGVDPDVFFPSPGGWMRDGHLLSVCRLNDPRKGLERMLRAYANLRQMESRAPSLILAGGGKLPVTVYALLTSLGLSSHVTVRSDVDPRELPSLYRRASVFVQTSYEEGLGISVLEAMASGLPVVCTDTAGTRETVVDGVTGILVQQEGDSLLPRVFAERIAQVLRGDGAGFGARARERCQQEFSTTVALRRFTDVYEDVLRAPVRLEDKHHPRTGR